MDRLSEDCYQLWKTCFTDTKQYRDFYFREVMGNNRVLTLYEEGVLTSMLHLNPYAFQFYDKRYLLHYIVGVATEPSYRNQGRMKQLMKEALLYMEGEGEPVTFLMPADEKIYLPFGFRYVYTQSQVWVNMDKLKQGKDGYNEYRAIPWDRCLEGDKERACLLVNGMLEEKFHIYAIKTVGYYERLQKEMKASNGNLILIFSGSQLLGVVSYMCENGSLEVTEAACLKKESETIIQETYRYALSERANREISQYVFLESAYVGFPRSYIRKTKEKPIIMMRVTHVQSFLSCLSGTEGEECLVRVEDEWIPNNNGVYRIVWGEYGAMVTKWEENRGDLVAQDLTQRISSVKVEDLIMEFQDREKVYINEIV